MSGASAERARAAAARRRGRGVLEIAQSDRGPVTHRSPRDRPSELNGPLAPRIALRLPVVVKSFIVFCLRSRRNRTPVSTRIHSYPRDGARVRFRGMKRGADFGVRAMRRGLLDLSIVERPTRWPAPTQLRGALDPSQHPPGALGLHVGLVGIGNQWNVTRRTSCPAINAMRSPHLLGRAPQLAQGARWEQPCCFDGSCRTTGRAAVCQRAS